MLSRIGKTDAGYLFEEKLGMGGFGSVFRVRRDASEPVAMKVLRADLIATSQATTRFEREVSAIRKIDHPSCIKIFDSGRLADGSPYFTMELLEGEDLSARLKREGRIPEGELRSILSCVCGALQEAHRQSIVHRDVKASNIFLCASGDVKLLDFGIAKFVDMPGMTLTMSRQIVGTPTSMAPEQLTGGVIDTRTDVYALGALSYYMLTGSQVFAASSATLLQHLHRHAARPRPSSRVSVSSAIDRAIVSAMSIEAKRRPKDAASFLRAFEAAFDGLELSEGVPAEAAIVFGFLGKGGQDEEAAVQGLQAMDAALAALEEEGYNALSVQSRGFVSSALIATDEFREEILLKIQKAFLAAAPPGAELHWKLGPVLCKDHQPISGEALIPRFARELVDEMGETV